MDPNREGEHKDKQPNTMDPYREGGRFDLPATTMRISATRQQEIAEKAERKRASASERMEKRDGDGEHITRYNEERWWEREGGNPSIPSRLPISRLHARSQNFWPPSPALAARAPGSQETKSMGVSLDAGGGGENA